MTSWKKHKFWRRPRPKLFAINLFKIYTDSPLGKCWEYNDIHVRYGPVPKEWYAPSTKKKKVNRQMNEICFHSCKCREGNKQMSPHYS